MNDEELKALKQELMHLLESGRIRPSISPYGAPIFVSQKDKLRLVFAYRALNKQTIKNRAPLPNITEILDRLRNAKFFTKIDLASGFHQIRIKEEDTYKTAFRTKYGHYEWIVMPFGLCNAPSTFQGTMNNIFSDFLDNFLTVYIDDLLIFSNTREEHLEHIRKVLKRMREHNLHCRLYKCEWMKTEVEYLGFHISCGKVSVLKSRLTAIADFEPPR